MWIKKRRFFLVGFAFSVFAMGCSMKETVMLNTETVVRNYEDVFSTTEDLEGTENITEEMDKDVEESSYIYVYICGEVKNPGVYRVKDTARVYDVVMEAGGYTILADEEVVNLADFIFDGLKIVIPTKEMESSRQAEEKDGTININTASEAKLQEIPGVGEVKAKAIIAYRVEKGRFSDVEEIMMVEGIKTATYEKIKEYIRVE